MKHFEVFLLVYFSGFKSQKYTYNLNKNVGSVQRYRIGHKIQGKMKQKSGHRKIRSKSKIVGQGLWGPSIRLDEFLFIILKNQLLREGI